MRELKCNLKDCFLCTSCMSDWKEAIAVNKQTLVIKKGKPVFEQGEKVKGIFFIYRGTIKVHKQWTDSKQLIIRFAKQGDVVGHRGIQHNNVYPVTATALEDSLVCFISDQFFKTSCNINPSFTYKLMEFFASELHQAEKRMSDLAHMDVKGRIADVLLEIKNEFGTDDEQFVRIALSRQEIASYAGTTYETVFRFFQELIKKKIITTSGKRIKILKEKVLIEYANQ